MEKSTIGGLVVVLTLTMLMLLFVFGGESHPAAHSPVAGTGDNVIVSIYADSCLGEVLLGRSKEIEDEIVRLATIGDKIGIAKMVLEDSAFLIPNCTHALVINRGFSLSEVRILEGKKIGEAGWIPFEWARKNK